MFPKNDIKCLYSRLWVQQQEVQHVAYPVRNLESPISEKDTGSSEVLRDVMLFFMITILMIGRIVIQMFIFGIFIQLFSPCQGPEKDRCSLILLKVLSQDVSCSKSKLPFAIDSRGAPDF